MEVVRHQNIGVERERVALTYGPKRPLFPAPLFPVPLSSQTMLFYDTLQCQINNLPLVRAGAVASTYTDEQKWTHTRHLNLSVIS
jgi:hypothetical protein